MEVMKVVCGAAKVIKTFAALTLTRYGVAAASSSGGAEGAKP